MDTKQEKLEFIVKKLTWLKGLEFIDDDEINAVNYANMILRNKVTALNKKEVAKDVNEKYIKDCPVNKTCAGCYRQCVCEQEENGLVK